MKSILAQVIGAETLGGCKVGPGPMLICVFLFCAVVGCASHVSFVAQDPGKQFALVREHMARLRTNMTWSRSPIIIFVERNLGFEASAPPGPEILFFDPQDPDFPSLLLPPVSFV